MLQTHPPKIFISYAWENQPLARQLQRDLQNDGVEVFVDYAQLKGGDSLPARISAALDWCDTLVLLWSKDAAQSRWVAREWECADQLEKRIFPRSGKIFLDFGKIPVEGYSKKSYLCRVGQWNALLSKSVTFSLAGMNGKVKRT